MWRMRHAGIDSVATPPVDPPRRGASGRGAARDASFQSHMAAYYPYAQPPVDPQPRAGAAEERQRSGAVGAAGAPQRRQSRRGDA
jgi:hypothetical protein